MKKLLRVEDIKIEKDDIDFFAHTPEELGIEGNMLRADTKEELERLIEEAVDRYNKDLGKRSDTYFIERNGKKIEVTEIKGVIYQVSTERDGTKIIIPLNGARGSLFDRLRDTQTKTPPTATTKTNIKPTISGPSR